jgi:hypothetical protein
MLAIVSEEIKTITQSLDYQNFTNQKSFIEFSKMLINTVDNRYITLFFEESNLNFK